MPKIIQGLSSILEGNPTISCHLHAAQVRHLQNIADIMIEVHQDDRSCLKDALSAKVEELRRLQINPQERLRSIKAQEIELKAREKMQEFLLQKRLERRSPEYRQKNVDLNFARILRGFEIQVLIERRVPIKALTSLSDANLDEELCKYPELAFLIELGIPFKYLEKIILWMDEGIPFDSIQTLACLLEEGVSFLELIELTEKERIQVIIHAENISLLIKEGVQLKALLQLTTMTQEKIFKCASSIAMLLEARVDFQEIVGLDPLLQDQILKQAKTLALFFKKGLALSSWLKLSASKRNELIKSC